MTYVSAITLEKGVWGIDVENQMFTGKDIDDDLLEVCFRFYL